MGLEFQKSLRTRRGPTFLFLHLAVDTPRERNCAWAEQTGSHKLQHIYGKKEKYALYERERQNNMCWKYLGRRVMALCIFFLSLKKGKVRQILLF